MMNLRRVAALVLAALAVIPVFACQTRNDQTATATMSPADSLKLQEVLIRGQRGFIAYCAMCHGDGGNGDGDVAPTIRKDAGIQVARLNDREMMSRLTRAQIEKVIELGGGHTGRSNLMPAWGEKLDPQVIDDIVTYVTVLPDSNPAIPRGTLENYLKAPSGEATEGRQLYLHHCSACHGAYGKGDGPLAERLWTEHQIRPRNLTDGAYIGTISDQQMFATISLGGGHFKKSTYMPAWTVTLTPTQIKSIIAYIREISNTTSPS